MQKMNSPLRKSLVSGVSCILIVLISFSIRNSQQAEEVTVEAPTLTLKDILYEAELSGQNGWNISNKADYCGPPEARASEEDGCFTLDGASVPCPTRAEHGAITVRKCIPPYGHGRSRGPFVGYFCSKYGWAPPYNSCYPDCGLPTKNNEHPWSVAIYKNEELTCTGTIITPLHVLSVISCFAADYNNKSIYNQELYTIIAGKHYINLHRKHKSAELRKIKRTIMHSPQIDQFNGFSFHLVNIVLFEVDKEFNFLGDIQPACLDWENFYDESDFRDGNEAVAVGWKYYRDQVTPCENQDEFNVQYWQHGTCKENVPGRPNNLDDLVGLGMFCGSYTGDQDLCGIAPGVGLFFKSSPWRYYLKGITSDFHRTENVTYIFYTKVSLFHDWIKEHIRHHAGYLQYFGKTLDRHQPVTTSGCRLPEHIKYGTFSLTLGKAYRVNTWVPSSTKITLSCAGREEEAPVIIRCSLGAWIPSIDKLDCKRPGSCPALPSSESEDVACRLNGQEVSCIDAEDNTTAIIQCKPFHTIFGNKLVYKCHNSKWDQSFTRCTVECGIKRVGVTTLTIGGSDIIKNEYPWVAAIYRFTELICSGTIISKKYVLSAAHCFTDSKGTPISKEFYTIIAGKYYTNISEVEPSAQSRKIISMHIHGDYKGKLVKYRDDIALIELDMELTPTWEVQPACVDWDNVFEDFDFVDGNKAVVTGWGNTNETGSPSTVLKKLVIPFRSKDVCVKHLPEDFSEQFVATDKICAGYEDSDKNVCSGDSGGGLYFKSRDNRFYVRGIVSLTVKNEVGACRANKFALYTKVSKYLTWMEAITRRIL